MECVGGKYLPSKGSYNGMTSVCHSSCLLSMMHHIQPPVAAAKPGSMLAYCGVCFCSFYISPLLSINLDVPLYELKTCEGESSSWCGPQQVSTTAFVETPEAICLPNLHATSRQLAHVNAAAADRQCMQQYQLLCMQQLLSTWRQETAAAVRWQLCKGTCPF